VRSLHLLGAFSGAEDLIITTWAAAIVTASGTVSAATRAIWSTQIKALRAKASLFSKINNGSSRLSAVCGDQKAAALVPFLVGGGGTTDTGNNLVNGDYTETTGIAGNASNKTIDINITPAQAGQSSSDACFIFWFGGSDTGTKVFCSNGSGHEEIYNAGGINWKYDSSSGVSVFQSTSQLDTVTYKASFGQSNVANALGVFRRGVSRTIAEVRGSASGSLGTSKYRALGRQGGGFETSLTLLGYYIGAGLTNQEVFDLNAIMEAGFTALGRSSFSTVTPIAFFGDSTTLGAGYTDMPQAVYQLDGTRMGSNHGVSGDTSTQIKTRLLAYPGIARDIIVIQAGTNNYVASASTVLSDIAAMVAAITATGNNKYLILTPLCIWSDVLGSANRTQYDIVRNGIISAYPSNYDDVFTALVASYDVLTPQDVIDHTNGVVPSTKRSDNTVHLNSLGYSFEATRVNNDVVAAAW